MLDIRGFTRLSQTLAARDTVQLLTAFHSAIVPIIARHHGVIDKFLGDGVMITFGAVTASPSAAADCLRALDEILVAAAAWSASTAEFAGQTLHVNAATVAGPVVFAALGNGDRLELTVIGDAVNFAAKLEKHNKALGCRALTTAATWELAVAQGYLAPVGQQHMTAAMVPGVTAATDLVVVA